MVCNNLIEQRLAGCPGVISCKTFLEAREYYDSHLIDSINRMDTCHLINNLPNVLVLTPGVIDWTELTSELLARLKISPNISKAIPEKRLALIRLRMVESSGRPVYEAVASLGIKLVVFDEPTHWARPDTAKNRTIREAFVETDMTEDAGLVDSLVHNILTFSHEIHGVFTLSDNYLVAVAQVAEQLNLPTNPSLAYEITVDKYRSRCLQDVLETACVKSIQDMNNLIEARKLNLKFPMIVKPVKGWSSECVSKVNSLKDLHIAIDKACSRHLDAQSCVIEPYFDGPEIDVNLTIFEGELLFAEISDEPPREGDAVNATVASSFSDEVLYQPSLLPKDEQDIAIKTMLDLLLSIGMRTGVFHVEARMSSSKSQYITVDGLTDLAIHADKDGQSITYGPQCNLIEINARPPGFSTTRTALHTYGVNYYQLHALAAIGDSTRFQILSRAFDFAARPVDDLLGVKAQSWTSKIYIPAANKSNGIVKTKKGISDDILSASLTNKDSVVWFHDDVKNGESVAEFTDGGRTFLASIILQDRSNRRRMLLQNVKSVREATVHDFKQPNEAFSLI